MADPLEFPLKIRTDLDSLNAAVNDIRSQLEALGMSYAGFVYQALRKSTGSFLSQTFAAGVAGHRMMGAPGAVGGVVSQLWAGGAHALGRGVSAIGADIYSATGGQGALGGAGQAMMRGGEAMGGKLAGAAGVVGIVTTTIVAAVGKGIQLAGKALGAVAQVAIVAPLKLMGNVLHEIQGPLGLVGAGLEILSTGLKGLASVIHSIPLIGTLLGPLADALAGVPDLLKGIVTSLVNMSKLADPGTFELWEMTLRDTQAVIGRAFVPVLRLMTETVKLFGDLLASILPNQREMNAALAELRHVITILFTEIRDSLGSTTREIRENLISAFRQLAHWAAVAAVAIWKVIKAFTGIGGRTRSILRSSQGEDLGSSADFPSTAGARNDQGGYSGSGADFKSPDEDKTRTQLGAAVRPVGVGSLENQWRMMQEALSGGTKDPMEELGKNTEDIRKMMERVERESNTLAANIQGKIADVIEWGKTVTGALKICADAVLWLAKHFGGSDEELKEAQRNVIENARRRNPELAAAMERAERNN